MYWREIEREREKQVLESECIGERERETGIRK